MLSKDNVWVTLRISITIYSLLHQRNKHLFALRCSDLCSENERNISGKCSPAISVSCSLCLCKSSSKVLGCSWRRRQRRTGDTWLCRTIMNDTVQTPLGQINKAAFLCPATSYGPSAAPRCGLCSSIICKMWFYLKYIYKKTHFGLEMYAL